MQLFLKKGNDKKVTKRKSKVFISSTCMSIADLFVLRELKHQMMNKLQNKQTFKYEKFFQDFAGIKYYK